jgi:galactose mutarotase-like enzyme
MVHRLGYPAGIMEIHLFSPVAAAVAIAMIASVPAAAEPIPVAQCAEKAGPLVRLGEPQGPLAAVVAPMHGGELVSLTVQTTEGARELLYRGLDFCDRPGWEGKAPILWPATGRNFLRDPALVPEGSPLESAFGWTWQGRSLPMPIHGFARSLAWRAQAADGRARSHVRVSLSDTPETRALYPFGFHMTVDYRLTGRMLTVRHRIVASPQNGAPMPFSIGNHITFALPALGATRQPGR